MTFAHLTLATRDVPATRDFYHTVLGWQPIQRPGNIDREAAWLEIAPGQQLHLLHVADFQPTAYEAEFGRHVALFQPGAEFPELRRRLQQHGAKLIEAQRKTPFARFFFEDPNGYIFEVIDQDQYVQEKS